MSRTYTHRPYRIQLLDPAMRAYTIEWHHHPDGVCDLDRFIAGLRREAPWARTRCRITTTGHRNFGCGCRICTGHHGRRLVHRQERTVWRGHRQRILALTDRTDVDVPPIHGNAW